MNIDLNADLWVELDMENPADEIVTDTQSQDSDKPHSWNNESTDSYNSSDSEIGESISRNEPTSSSFHLKRLSEITARIAEGSELHGLDEAYVLYCEYARLMGFSVKKGTQGYFPRTDKVRMKIYLCSCEGHNENRASRNKLAVYKKQNTRSGCKARLRISREYEGPWKVSVFVEEHNHDLLPPEESYLLRSARNMSHAKKSILETFNDAGIGVSMACKFMEKEAGGPQNLGFIRKDAYDHIGKLRRVSKLDNNDAESLLLYFQTKQTAEPDFFWRVLLDDEGRLMNFFFRDTRSASDYEFFGDVLSVDTTFKTNKYNLLCAPFVGVNHHRQNILFGVAFLSDETTETFQWLFSTFLESMGGKEPQIVFSDQDQALMNGIDCTFKSAKHRLCQWHINHNAPSHFGKLNSNKEFREAWFHCMNGCETEEEFERCWRDMSLKFGLNQKRWFSGMYKLRQRWASVYTNTRFTAGLHATSRSEATNKVIKDLCAASCSLFGFVTQYESIITDWRAKERAEDVNNRGLPGLFIEGNPYLIQGATIYTRHVFNIFQLEVASSLNEHTSRLAHNVEEGDMMFNVTSEGSNRTRLVSFNQITGSLSCSCRMLETDGIFCRHIASVFHYLKLPTLPEQHFLKRWSKGAKNRNRETLASLFAKRGSIPDLVFAHDVVRRIYDMALDFSHAEANKEIIIYYLDICLEALINKDGRGNKTRTTVGTHTRASTKERFQNPKPPNHKWRPARRGVKRTRTKNQVPEREKSATLNDNTSIETNTKTASYARPYYPNANSTSQEGMQNLIPPSPHTIHPGYMPNEEAGEDFLTEMSMV